MTSKLFDRQQRQPIVVLGIAIGVFVLFFGASNWFRHVNLHTSQFDMGNMDQVLWHSVHGQWFQMTSPVLAERQLRTAVHADYFLLAYLPFYALFPDPRTPLLLQVFAVASGAIPLYLLGRKLLSAWTATALAVLYLLFPAQEWATIFDVHAVVLAMPLFFWAWWAAAERRFWLYYPLIFFTALTKEEIGFTVAAMGLYWIWKKGYRIMGIATILFGVGWAVIMLGVVIPTARSSPGHFALPYYSDYGNSYLTIAQTLFAHPTKIANDFFGSSGLSLLRALFLPVGLVALFAAPVLIILPELGINLLSNDTNLRMIFFHYMSAITPFIFIASIYGIVRIRHLLDLFLAGKTRVVAGKLGGTGLAVCAVVAVWYWSPLPGANHSYDAMKVFSPSPYRDDVAVVQKLVQPSDRIATTNNLAPQFSRRDMIWSFPIKIEQADAIVVLEGGQGDVVPQKDIHIAVESLLHDTRFTLAYHRDLFWFFHRKG